MNAGQVVLIIGCVVLGFSVVITILEFIRMKKEINEQYIKITTLKLERDTQERIAKNKIDRYEQLRKEYANPKTKADCIYAKYAEEINNVRNDAFRIATMTPYPSLVNYRMQEKITRLEKERDEKIEKANNGKEWYQVIIHYKGIGEHNFSFEWDEKTFNEVRDSLDSVMRAKDYSISILDGSGNSLTIDPKEILFIKTGRINA